MFVAAFRAHALRRVQPVRIGHSVASFSKTATASGVFRSYLTEKIIPNIKEITPHQLDQRLTSDPVNGPPDTLHVLDVRETYEWNYGHIPGAIYTGRGCLERDIEGIVPDTSDEIVVYCAGGTRSMLAAHALQEMGYKHVYNLAGGFGRWKNDGLEIQPSESYSKQIFNWDVEKD